MCIKRNLCFEEKKINFANFYSGENNSLLHRSVRYGNGQKFSTGQKKIAGQMFGFGLLQYFIKMQPGLIAWSGMCQLFIGTM